MSQSIRAIYEGGVFRPLEPVNLPEHVQVEISLDQLAEATASPEVLARQQSAILQMLEDSARIAPQSPEDGFSNRDHDRVLYGDRQ